MKRKVILEIMRLTENPSPSGSVWIAGVENGTVLLDKLPFFDKIDREIGLGAVLHKPPFPTIFRSVGSFVNNKISMTGIGDNPDVKIHRLFGIRLDVNITVCPEYVSCAAVVISCNLAIVNFHPLGVRHAKRQTKKEQKQKFLHQEKFSTKIEKIRIL